MIQFLYTTDQGRWYFTMDLASAKSFAKCFGSIGYKWDDTYSGYKFMLL